MSESVQSRLGNIEGKLDMLIGLHKNTEKRLGAVEKRVWWSAGAAFVLAFIAGKLQLPFSSR